MQMQYMKHHYLMQKTKVLEHVVSAIKKAAEFSAAFYYRMAGGLLPPLFL